MTVDGKFAVIPISTVVAAPLPLVPMPTSAVCAETSEIKPLAEFSQQLRCYA